MLSEKLLEEWHFERNTLAPDAVKSKSGLKVWWLGKCGHEWQAVVYSRTAGRGCPVCAGKVVVAGFNDFGSQFPHLLSSWSPNNVLPPERYTSSSGRKVLWVCDKNHEWEATIDNRVKGRGCPVCAGRKVLVGFNDLATLNPELVSQWSFKNVIQPYEVTVKSNRKVLWACDKGHEWEAIIASRTNGAGCPTCAGNICVEGYNDLATLYPHLVKEWHPTKNLVDPNKITATYSKHKVWWVGACGHEWEATVGNRTRMNSGCPYCSGRVPILGLTDLATTHPNLVKEFHKEKNPLGLLEKISHGSDVKVWWLGECGHEWEAMVYSRSNSKPTGCPHCSALRTSSIAEKELQNFVKNVISFPVVFNARSVIYPYELDVYVPSKKIAFEFNGVYWHDEHHKDRNYHYDKWKACKEKGIQLIQVWEDDWETKPDVVKIMIMHKLGVTEKKKIYARNTFMKTLTQLQSNKFLDQYHIQGAVDGGIRVGLFENITVSKPFQEKPVAVMVLKREPGTEGKTLNLLRFATSQQVVGGFTKLLKHVEQGFNPESIVTFSDNCVSDGGLYEKHGFESVKELKPDYMYVVNKRREHKFNYRLKRFETDPNLIFDIKLSERELALLNNIPRIWDAGKIKWKLNFKA